MRGDRQEDRMQHVEEWSVGGQDSAYFSDRAGTPSRQRGLYVTLQSVTPANLTHLRFASRRSEHCQAESVGGVLLLAGPGEETVLVHRK